MNSDENKNEIWVSQAQKEVWEWKEKLYEDTKHLSTREAFEYIINKTKKQVEELKTNQKENTDKSE